MSSHPMRIINVVGSQPNVISLLNLSIWDLYLTNIGSFKAVLNGKQRKFA